MAKKDPRHDIPAEMAYLGTLLLWGESAPHLVSLVRPEDFYRSTHQTIFRSICSLVESNVIPDELMIFDELRQSNALDNLTIRPKQDQTREAAVRAYLYTLTSSASSANAERYARIIRERAQVRRILTACMQSEQALLDGTPAAQVLAQLGNDTQTVEGSAGCITAKDFMQELIDMEAPEKFATGFPQFDELFQGGLHPGLTILAGPTGSGKTTLQTQWGIRAARAGHDGYWIMGDMHRIKLGIYLVAREAQLFEGYLWDGKAEHLKAKMDALASLSGLPFTLHSGGMSIQDVCMVIECRVARGCRWFLLDSLQLVDVPGEVNEWRASEKVARKLQRLAARHGIYILVTCEWRKKDEPDTRRAKKRERRWPHWGDAKGGAGVFHAADELIICWPPRENETQLFWLIVDKSRSGETPRKVDLDFRGAQHRFVPV